MRGFRETLNKPMPIMSEGNALRKKLLKYDINVDVELFQKKNPGYPNIVQNSLALENLQK